jgi:hypothetical protein
MKGKAAFVIGAALGYLFGTDQGRVKLEKAKGWATDTWKDPRVQEKVSEVSSTATHFAKEKAGALKEKASGSSSSGSTGTPGPAAPGASTPGSTTAPGTTPGPDVDKPPMGL